MEPNITLPEKKKFERGGTNVPHMERLNNYHRHFVCVLLICSHALMLTGIAIISFGKNRGK